MNRMVCVEVDVLTSSVIEVSSGLTFETDATKIDNQFIKDIHKKNGWKFNWKREFKTPHREIFKLTLKKNKNVLLGMISLEMKFDHIHLHLVESSPPNIGKQKEFLGIGGNLFAFACKVSKDCGFEGNISFIAKTNLIQYYSINLDAQHLGNGKMIIKEYSATTLINKYFPDEKTH